MQLPDCPGTFEGTHEPGTERPDADAPGRLDLDPGPVLRFAQELGRLLGDHLAINGESHFSGNQSVQRHVQWPLLIGFREHSHAIGQVTIGDGDRRIGGQADA